MSCEVKVIAASRRRGGNVILWSLQLRYWRAIHGELMTHRVFSRNAGSSRATPVKKVLAQVWNDPAGPIHWGANQAGMQARAQLVGWRLAAAGGLWRTAGKVMCGFAWGMMKLGLHKQVANRLLEPWQYINVLVSSTEWDNFFALRAHPDAQPEFEELAREIRHKMSLTIPQNLSVGQWHLPYIRSIERLSQPLLTNIKVSAARCARISIEPFDGDGSVLKEIARHDLLVGSVPIHASPTEHQAQVLGDDSWVKNFRGFSQYRCQVENGELAQKLTESMEPAP